MLPFKKNTTLNCNVNAVLSIYLSSRMSRCKFAYIMSKVDFIFNEFLREIITHNLH